MWINRKKYREMERENARMRAEIERLNDAEEAKKRKEWQNFLSYDGNRQEGAN